MNVLDKEKELTVLLFECVNKIKEYETSKRIKSMDTRLFESNINSLYNEYQNINETQDMKSPITMNNQKNIYAYLNKVVKFYKNSDIKIVNNLNESLKSLDNKKNQHDFDGFINYIKKYIKKLEKSNDFDKLNNKILKIKSTLNQPIFVYGFPLNEFDEKGIKEIIFDKSHNFIIISTDISISGYDVKNDEYMTLTDFYADKISNDDLIFLVNSINSGKYSLYEILTNTIHRNFFKLYVDSKTLGLKFTDNLYQDAAQKAMVADYEKSKKLAQSNRVIAQFFNTQF